MVVDTRIFDRIRESIGEVLTAEHEDNATTVWVGGIPAAVVAGADPHAWSEAGEATVNLRFHLQAFPCFSLPLP